MPVLKTTSPVAIKDGDADELFDALFDALLLILLVVLVVWAPKE